MCYMFAFFALLSYMCPCAFDLVVIHSYARAVGLSGVNRYEARDENLSQF